MCSFTFNKVHNKFFIYTYIKDFLNSNVFFFLFSLSLIEKYNGMKKQLNRNL